MMGKKLVKLKPTFAWVLKQKDSYHPVVQGIYLDKWRAEQDLADIPNTYQERSKYHIIRVRVHT